MNTTTTTTITALDVSDAIIAGTAAFAETFRATAFEDGRWFASSEAFQVAIGEAVTNARKAIAIFLEINNVQYEGSDQSASKLGVNVHGQDYLRPGVACFWFKDGSAIEVMFPTYHLEQDDAPTGHVRAVALGMDAARINVEGAGYIS